MSGRHAEIAFRAFVLQDVKRLPGRFFAQISGALLSRLA